VANQTALVAGYDRKNPIRTLRHMRKQWQLYLFVLLPVAFVIIFAYVPMYGVVLAFKDYNVRLGILGSPWAGTKYFQQFFSSPMFSTTISNTLLLSLYSLIVGFPIPIILALFLNEVRFAKFKKTVQLVTYAPYFISTVVMVGMLLNFLHTRHGFINIIIQSMGFEAINFMANPNYFRTIFIASGIWQTMGYSAIIYIAALSNADPTLYEAAIIDGANRYQKIKHIDIPTILPTATLLLILSMGSLMSVGVDKVLLMQNPLNLQTSEVISTYVYKVGLLSGQFSFATAVGVFNSVVNFILIVVINTVASKVGETSLW